MRYIGRGLYQCPHTLELFTLRVVWEFGTLTRIYEPAIPAPKSA